MEQAAQDPSIPALDRSSRQRRPAFLQTASLAVLLLAALLGPGSAAAQDPGSPAGQARPDGQRGSNVLRIGSDGASPPYSLLDPARNELTGFDIDLMRAVCTRLDRPCEFRQREYDRLLNGLARGRVDVVVGGLEIGTDDRMRIAFSSPYLRVPVGVLVAAQAPAPDLDPGALADQPIGAVDATRAADFAQATFPQSRLSTYGRLEDAILDMLAGRIVLVVADRLSIAEWLSRPDGIHVRHAGDLPYDPAILGEGLGIAVRPSDTMLRRQIDAALDKLRADGTMTTIARRWLPFDPP